MVIGKCDVSCETEAEIWGSKSIIPYGTFSSLWTQKATSISGLALN
jgi:hypothetical protein